MNKKLLAIKSLYENGKHFFAEELWEKDTSALPVMRRFLFALCRVCMVVIHGFQQDKCSLQASALTYITLVSMVPVLAIMFSFSKGIGMQKKILSTVGVERVMVTDPATGEKVVDYKIVDSTQSPPEAVKPTTKPTTNSADVAEGASAPVGGSGASSIRQAGEGEGLARKLPKPMQEALIKIFKYVDNTNFAAMGVIGSVMLLFGVVGSMSKLEKNFNTIWGVKKARSLPRKFSEYLVILILVPVVFMVATSMNTFILSNRAMVYMQSHFGAAAELVRCSLNLLGIVFVLFMFGMFYMFMPNTRVKALPALAGGFLAGIIWFGIQWAYMSLQVGLTKFNSIYGTFAVVPFFLAWLYANWSIILLGAEITFAIQNHRTIMGEKASENASTGVCIVIGQLVLYNICRSFHQGKGPWNAFEYGQKNNISSRLLRHVMDVLTTAHVVVRVAPDDEDCTDVFLPGRDIAALSPADVEEAFRQNQGIDTRAYLNELPKRLQDSYRETYKAYCDTLSALTFGKLLEDERMNAAPGASK